MQTSALSLLCYLSFLSVAQASVTVYSQVRLGSPTGTASGSAASYTGAAAYDPTILNPPPIPSPAPATQFTLQLASSAQNVQGLSIPQPGAFFGFSIEMSVINQVIGINSTFLQVPFLNLMANVKERAGRVHVRVGGNTQEYATVVPTLADGKDMEKDKTSLTNPTQTPGLFLTYDIFYMLANVTALTNVNWYLGVPFNDTSNFRLQIAEIGEAVLGDHLLGLQVGNEPDLYSAHGHRPQTYSPSDYFGEFGTIIQAIANDANIPVKNNLIGPSVSGTWTPEDVWNTGFVPSYSSSLGALAVEHYPTDNCYAEYGIGQPVDPQTVFPQFLTHASGQGLVAPYLNSTNYAQSQGKPFLMFETNTASCGGFPGISDSFGAALWALDYGLQMAYSNFSGAMLHVGGQNVYYNPFTPPPTNESSYNQWTIGPVYYSVLALAEAFGTSNNSRIIDLGANSQNQYTPAYAIYEGSNLVKVALFNFMTDPSGANTYTATISIDGSAAGLPNGVPTQAHVKYLLAPSVSSKTDMTWAGQTLGGVFQSDGRLAGSLNVETVTCDQNANTCQVQVPAPGFALVFLSQSSLSEVSPSAPQTFPTTAYTQTINTVTINPSVLATSNGRGRTGELGSTSKGNPNGASRVGVVGSGVALLLSIVVGAFVIGREAVRL
ncbi:glycoside hydrolase family 79 protein [Serpula lacrymans var. lacrymans S7.3]|uniref:Glycoside hydrolase family 79 protein n=2 Tax=Serpula lacrymans var. lacrymans TaxID=341189 RepID=F8QHB1_SERL3|nr:glycoside hydrolase family 79 protein [Serpula lacrymans var. lacrymans S7.3]